MGKLTVSFYSLHLTEKSANVVCDLATVLDSQGRSAFPLTFSAIASFNKQRDQLLLFALVDALALASDDAPATGWIASTKAYQSLGELSPRRVMTGLYFDEVAVANIWNFVRSTQKAHRRRKFMKFTKDPLAHITELQQSRKRISALECPEPERQRQLAIINSELEVCETTLQTDVSFAHLRRRDSVRMIESSDTDQGKTRRKSHHKK